MRIGSFPGTVGFKAINIIHALKPKAFILEDVEGLVKMHKETFASIITSIEDIPAQRCSRKKLYNVSWRVLNSADYGTPQNRRRLYIVGVHRDLLAAASQESFSWPKPCKMKSIRALIKPDQPADRLTHLSFTRLRNFAAIKDKFGKRATSAGSQDIVIGDLDSSPSRGTNAGTVRYFVRRSLIHRVFTPLHHFNHILKSMPKAR